MNDAAFLSVLRTKYLGKKGLITELTSNMSSLSIEEKKEVGRESNLLKMEIEDKLKELKLDYKSIRDALNNHSNYYIPRLMGMSEEEQKVYLDNALEKEKNTMILDLYRRINEEVGDITDASDLQINAGNLNGIVIGTNGKARVETIGAGGYNTDVVLDSGRHGQRFHFRTLVKPI